MSDDDLVDPSEIEKLLAGAGHANPPAEARPAATGESPDNAPAQPNAGPSEPSPPPSQTTTPVEGVPAEDPAPDSAGGDLLGADEIEALLRQAGGSPDELADNAAAGVAAAMAPGVGPESPSAQPFVFEEFGATTGRALAARDIAGLKDVELDLRIELGRTEMLIEDVLKLKSGSVVELDKLAGDPVDILVNGRLVARGEVLVLNDNFCVRVAEILSPES